MSTRCSRSSRPAARSSPTRSSATGTTACALRRAQHRLRPPQPVPSSVSETPTALEFTPVAATLERVIAVLDDHGGASDAALRREALARYEELPAPGARPNRGWKYDYAALSFDELRWTSGSVAMATAPARPLPAARHEEADAVVDQPALAVENAGGLFFIGATRVDAPSDADPRITLRSLSDAVRAGAPGLAGVLHQIVDWRADKFAALATAFENCGAYVHVPDGVQLDTPIQLVFASAPDDEAVFPHVVVILGKGARATVLERHVGERDAQVRWHLAELGGALARTVLGATLAAPGARAEASALFFNTGMQHVDLTSG